MSDKSNTPSAEIEQLRGQLDGLRGNDPAASLADAKQRVGATVSDVAASVTGAVAEPLRQGADRVRDVVDSARKTAAQVSAQKDSLTQRIQSQPFAALGVAVLTGYVFGRIVR